MINEHDLRDWEDSTVYQKATQEFRLPTYIPEAAVMGLLSEAGEVAGVFQKLMRGDFDNEEATRRLFKELGDTYWHIAAICADNGWTLAELAKGNIDNLTARRLRGAIKGDGSDR